MTLETLTTLQWWIIGALYVGGSLMALAVPERISKMDPTKMALVAVFWPFVVLCLWPIFLALEFTKGGR
jgi:hypothetical protein